MLDPVLALAWEFACQLRHYVGVVGLQMVAVANAVEPDPGICHSHDNCDANQAMIDACARLGYPDPCDDLEFVSAAWTLARQNAFWWRQLSSYPEPSMTEFPREFIPAPETWVAAPNQPMVLPPPITMDEALHTEVAGHVSYRRVAEPDPSWMQVGRLQVQVSTLKSVVHDLLAAADYARASMGYSVAAETLEAAQIKAQRVLDSMRQES